MKLDRLNDLWETIQTAAHNRGKSLEEALVAAEKFWDQLTAVMKALKELQGNLNGQEPPAVEPAAVQQQQEGHFGPDGGARSAHTESELPDHDQKPTVQQLWHPGHLHDPGEDRPRRLAAGGTHLGPIEGELHPPQRQRLVPKDVPERNAETVPLLLHEEAGENRRQEHRGGQTQLRELQEEKKE